MAGSYSTYEAKARFSEILRKVRAGQRIVISYRGHDVAEIARVDGGRTNIAARLAELEDRGVVTAGRGRAGRLRALARRPGALRRFLGARR
ncbi:MAG TPA: type II toxin-antitoxin system prevent-host-death family antitoxin [bacterium]|nr:type II toxin-antitoxin system prevent-host-death family antitoxin [bacterium]